MTAKSAKSGRPTVWITDQSEAEPLFKERMDQLAQIGFDVSVVHDLAGLIHILKTIRVSTVLIDTLGHKQSTRDIIKWCAASAELATARSVLIQVEHQAAASKEAMAAGFRDIVPWNIPNQDWLNRIQYATAPRPINLPMSLCALTVNQPAVIRMPARVVWINDTHIRLETRGSQSTSSSFFLSGPLAQAFGVEHIHLTVESVHKDRLLYRFSQALVARWRVPPEATAKALQAIASLSQSDASHPRVRVFLAVARADWRKLIIDTVAQERHEINVALTRANIAKEFKYFSPDVVIFDDRVLNNIADDELIQMFQNIPTDIPLIVVGANFNQVRTRQILLGRPLFIETTVSGDSFKALTEKYRITPHIHDAIVASQVTPIYADDEKSHGEIEISARLHSVNPKSGTLTLPFAIGNFAVARLESPLFSKGLARDVYIKVIGTGQSQRHELNPQFPIAAEFLLSDMTEVEAQALSRTLLATAVEYYNRQFNSERQLLAHSEAPAVTTVAPGNQDENAKEESTTSVPASEEPDKGKVYQLNQKSVSLMDQFDPIIVKAMGVFVIAAFVMGLIIYAATHVDESAYIDHGKEYTEFFKRMKDPDYSKQNPAASGSKEPSQPAPVAAPSP
jgi:hypothetical protein